MKRKTPRLHCAQSARSGFLLGPQEYQLRIGQLFSLEINRQAVDRPGDVAQVESDRPEAVGRGPDVFVREPVSPRRQILAGHLKGIEQGRDEGVDARDGPG